MVMQTLAAVLPALGLHPGHGQPQVTDAVLDQHVLTANIRVAGETYGVRLLVDDLHVTVTDSDGVVVRNQHIHKDVGLPVPQNISVVHKDLDTDLSWSVSRPDDNKARFSSTAASIELYDVQTAPGCRPQSAMARVSFHPRGVARITGAKDIQRLRTAYQNAVTQAAVNQFGLGWAINVVGNNNTIVLNYPNKSAGVPKHSTSTDFESVRDRLLDFARNRRLRKRNGIIYMPVESSPCAYRERCSYKDLINEALAGDPVFLRHPKRSKELMEFLDFYDHADLPTLRVDRDYLSFTNGILQLSTGILMPFAESHHLVARHHIEADYSAIAETPLLDKIMTAQFSEEVSDLLLVLLGRLFFRVGQLDRWQVMPYLVGCGGTGKSLILSVVENIFGHSSVAYLSTSREEVFGLANIYHSDLVMGRDMPAKVSGCISQDDLQCMTAGEGMSVQRKGKEALNVTWTAPLIMASNHMPDYVNKGNNIGRRIVTFRFDNPIANPQEDLLDLICAHELPNIVCRALETYHRHRHLAAEAGGFWKSVPDQIRVWQGILCAATNKLYDFLSMDDDDRRCIVTSAPGRVTWLSTFKAAMSDAMHMGTKEIELDPSILAQFGFSLSADRVWVCAACKQPPNARANKCCDEYSSKSREKQRVIYNMELRRIYDGAFEFRCSSQRGEAAAEPVTSASERAFRVAVTTALPGACFQHNVRPTWLEPLELDLYDPVLRLAVEYDGPHHHEFPNMYHRDMREFEVQQRRDRLKDELCARHSVRLFRVRCMDGGAEVEAENLAGQLRDAGLLSMLQQEQPAGAHVFCPSSD